MARANYRIWTAVCNGADTNMMNYTNAHWLGHIYNPNFIVSAVDIGEGLSI